MSSNGQSGVRGNSDPEDQMMVWGLFFALVLVGGYFFWKNNGDDILFALLNLKEWQISFLEKLYSGHTAIRDLKAALEIQRQEGTDLTTYNQFGIVLGIYTRWVFGGLCLALTAYLTYKLARKEIMMFPANFDLQGLIIMSSKEHLGSLPFVTYNPADAVNHAPGAPFEASLNPEEFSVKHDLIFKRCFRIERALHAFKQQVNKDISHYKPKLYEEALIAAFLFHLTKSEPTSVRGRFGLTKQLQPGTVNECPLAHTVLTICGRGWGKTHSWEKAEPLIKKDLMPLIQMAYLKGGKKWVEILNNHTDFNAAMMSLLAECRKKSGVMPTSWMSWLREPDRALFYSLNAVGRNTHYVEVAGIFSHWDAEVKEGRKIILPRVQETAHGLYEQLVLMGQLDEKAAKITEEEYEALRSPKNRKVRRSYG